MATGPPVSSTEKNDVSDVFFREGYRWNNGSNYTIETSRWWFEISHTIFTVAYFTVLFKEIKDYYSLNVFGIFIALFIVLTALPFYRVYISQDSYSPTKGWIWNTPVVKSAHVRTAISSLPLFISVIILEAYIGGQSHLVLYFSTSVLFRLVGSRFVYDGVALCVAYGVNIVVLSSDYEIDFLAISRLVLLAGLIIGLMCGNIISRVGIRIWKLVRCIIIIRRKAKRERTLAVYISRGHFSPKDFQYMRNLNGTASAPEMYPNQSQASQPSGRLLRKSSSSNTDGPAISPPANAVGNTSVSSNSNKSNDEAEDPIISAAKDAGIVFKPPVDCPSLTADEIRSLNGLQRKFITVITFKVIVEEEREHEVNNQLVYGVLDWLDGLAAKHGVSSCRRFGEAWIGCVGFFPRSPESQPYSARSDCLQAIKLGCEAVLVANKLRLRLVCAVEAGKIDCGYHHDTFELFGPEMRWILNTLETHRNGFVIVGNNARSMLSKPGPSELDPAIAFEKIAIDVLWKMKGKRMQASEKYYAIEDMVAVVGDKKRVYDLHISDGLLKVPYSANISSSLFELGPASEVPESEKEMPWETIQSMLTDAEFLRPAPSRKRVGFWTELCAEFVTSIEERFGVSLNDEVVNELAPTELDKLHKSIEKSIHSLTYRHLFGGVLWRQLLFWVPKKYIHDRVQPVDETLSDDSVPVVDFFGPLESLWGLPQRNGSKFHSFHDYLQGAFDSFATVMNHWLLIIYGSESSKTYERKDGPAGVGRRNMSSDGSDAEYAGESADNFGEPHSGIKSALNQSSYASKMGESGVPPLHLKPNGVRLKSENFSSSLESVANRLGLLKVWSRFTLAMSGNPSEEGKSERCLAAYVMDLRAPSHSNALVSPLICTFFCAAAAYAGWDGVYSVVTKLDDNVRRSIMGPDTSFGLLGLYYILIMLMEHNWNKPLGIVFIAFRLLIIISFSIKGICGTPHIDPLGVLNSGRSLLLILLWIPIALRQGVLWNIAEFASAALRLILLLNSCTVNPTYSYALIPVYAFLYATFWIVEYISIISYVAEHVVLPRAHDAFVEERRKAREMLQACIPQIPSDKGADHYCPRRYRNCSIFVVNIRAADILPGLVDVDTFSAFMSELSNIISNCMKENGLIFVSKFSGTFIGACPELPGNQNSLDHKTRATLCVRKFQAELEQFCKQNSINVSIGVGLHSGPATIGLLGNKRFGFDLTGSARDLAVAMACYHSDGIYAAEQFGPVVKTCMNLDDAVLHEYNIKSMYKTTRWLRIESAFNKGLQLDDFEYICMLGKGGYGSVHLVWENMTGKQYAIKAIPRKRSNAAIPKMIQREFNILQQMQHPNVVSFKFCIVNTHMIYLIMSYVRGGSLKEIIDRNKLELKHLTLWFAELVLALDYIHSLGIIHRDVKPANCMIDSSGHLKLADFGLSKVVAPSVPITVPMPTPRRGIISLNDSSAAIAGGGAGGTAGGGDGSSAVFATTGSGSGPGAGAGAGTGMTGPKGGLDLVRKVLPLKSNFLGGTSLEIDSAMHVLLLDQRTVSVNAVKLKEMYFTVTLTKTLESALKYIQDAKIDIAVVDLDSLSINGTVANVTTSVELIQKLQEAVQDKFIPLIGLSQTDDFEVQKKYLTAGARELLSTPLHKASRDTLLKYGRLHRHMSRESDAVREEVMSPRIFPEAGRFQATKSSASRTQKEGADGAVAIGTAVGAVEATAGGGAAVTAAAETTLPNAAAQDVGTTTVTNDPNRPPRSVAVARMESERATHSVVGTVHFMSPEIIANQRYGRSVDWWACGVTFYECTMREHLFHGVDRAMILQGILTGPIDLEPLRVHSAVLHNLVSGMLHRDPLERLGTAGAHTIMMHEFFQGVDWDTISQSDPDFKPSQQANRRHSDKDKRLFYGADPVMSKLGIEEVVPEADPKKNRKQSWQRKKKGSKRIRLPHRKDAFDRLEAKRRDWVSGNRHNGADPGANAGGQRAGGGGGGGVAPVPTSADPRYHLSASLNWSITVLPEEEESSSSSSSHDSKSRSRSLTKSVAALGAKVSSQIKTRISSMISNKDTHSEKDPKPDASKQKTKSVARDHGLTVEMGVAAGGEPSAGGRSPKAVQIATTDTKIEIGNDYGDDATAIATVATASATVTGSAFSATSANTAAPSAANHSTATATATATDKEGGPIRENEGGDGI